MHNKSNTIYVFALSALGQGLSGGDRIFIEFVRFWSKLIPVNLYLWEEGLLMCKREKLSGRYLKTHLIRVGNLSKLGFIFTYFYRIFLGIKLGFSLKLDDNSYVYSAFEFWMDLLPALILKFRYPKIKWIAAWYQTSPNPIQGFTEGKRNNRYRWNALKYWCMQKPVKPLIAKFANFVLVNNDKEKSRFSKLLSQNKVLAIGGGVNTKAIANYLKTHRSPNAKKYLAVFQGRFHPQKGVVELIDIWKLVVQRLPSAKLAMIGDGPLMKVVRSRIQELHLEDNVELFGYLYDGSKKYSIFQKSKMVVHSSFYDSGGIAIWEAMSFGLPCVSFNLKDYSTYFPKSMLKVPRGNLMAFANKIVAVSVNQALYNRAVGNAEKMNLSSHSWESRAKEVLTAVS